MMHGWEHLRPEDRRLILRGIKKGEALGGPYHVELDPVDVCNVNCFFCNSAEFRQGAILPWERLGPLVDELIRGGLRSFRFAGGGEPTLYPDIEKMCARMAEAGIVLENLTTNGVRLDSNRIALFLPLRPTHYHVSLNYASAGQYARFMQTPADRFDTVLDNIRLLDRMLCESQRRAECQIHIQFFIHRSTVEDIPAMMDLAVELPVDTVTLRAVGGIAADETLLPHHLELVREFLPDAAERARERVFLMFDLEAYGLGETCATLTRKLYAANLDAEPWRPPAIEYCYVPWYSMTIQGSGAVHGCCYLMPDKSVPHLGDLNRQSVADVWYGEPYRAFRSEIRRAILAGPDATVDTSGLVHSLPKCLEHNWCPMSHNLADTPFYIAAHRSLEWVRHGIAGNLGRMARRAMRRTVR
jgi:MoaA/NifB/PqqE/SkfB family radical SAM enzyme